MNRFGLNRFGLVWFGLSLFKFPFSSIQMHVVFFCLLHCIISSYLELEVLVMATTSVAAAIRNDVNGAVTMAVLFTCQLRKYNRFLMLTISG